MTGLEQVDWNGGIANIAVWGVRGQNFSSINFAIFADLLARLLNDDPATTAFYNAKLRTEKRVMCMHALSVVMCFPQHTCTCTCT